MIKKLVVALTIFCYVQKIQAETADQVIQEFKPKLDALRIKLDNTIQTDGINIGQAHSNLQLIINKAEAQLDNALSNLNTIVDQAKADAKANGKNIEQCVIQENAAIQNINRKSLELCRNDERLNLLAQKLGQLGTLKSVIGLAPQNCKSQSVNNVSKLRVCLENVIDDVNNKMDSVVQEIDSTLTSVEGDARKCAETNGNELNTSIANILSDFKGCVDKS